MLTFRGATINQYRQILPIVEKKGANLKLQFGTSKEDILKCSDLNTLYKRNF